MLYRIYQDLEEYLKSKKVLILYGPRRVGKTTLLENYLKKTPFKYRLDSGENIRIQNVLGSNDFPRILEYSEGYQLIAIDEAQCIPNIGQALKIIVDHVPEVRVIATGSSSFDLHQHLGEPLTGRKRTLTLYPLSQFELLKNYNPFDLKGKLEEYLLFGSYPEVLLAPTRQEKIELLQELVDSYILKDILAFERIKGPDVLLKLVQLLAFQVGQLVSLHELATQLHLDVKTVGRYLDLLQKSFVIYKLSGFSKNLRNEITQKCKYYFLDNGIRNAVISHFNALELRNDVGNLWENFLMMERLKKQTYTKSLTHGYFWRTYDSKEIDLVEQENDHLVGYEFKWSAAKKVGPPKRWKESYPSSSFEVITPENYLAFVT